MVKEFKPEDLIRMRKAQEEKREFAKFLAEKFVQYARLTNMPNADRIAQRVSIGALRLVNDLEVTTAQNTAGKDVAVFVLEEGIGGDRFSVDYAIHYLPEKFVFETDEWIRDYSEIAMKGWAYPQIQSGHRSSRY